MGDIRQAVERLRHAAAAGDLGALCDRFGATLLVAFGSAVGSDQEPNDLDLAVAFRGRHPDLLGFLDELAEIARTSQIDLMDLGRAGPVARERALVGSEPLFEQQPGTFAGEQLAAIMERLDTDWLRRVNLELMAGSQ